jgi:hypothetical protein
MHRADLLKRDLLSEIVLLGLGALIFRIPGASYAGYPHAILTTQWRFFSGGFMPPAVQVGSILIEEQPLMAQILELETEVYAGNWSLVKALDGSALDHKIRDVGWNFFFMAAGVKSMFFGTIGAEKVRNALYRILGKVRQQDFNALEVTGIVTKSFLGIP